MPFPGVTMSFEPISYVGRVGGFLKYLIYIIYSIGRLGSNKQAGSIIVPQYRCVASSPSNITSTNLKLQLVVQVVRNKSVLVSSKTTAFCFQPGLL